MVELDSYSSVDWSHSSVNCDKAQALSPTSEAKTFSRLGAGFVVSMVRATW
jgi:hypothetical protein